MNFTKNYIGKGKQIKDLAIAKCTCKLQDLEKFSYEYDGIRYVTFEVAKMKTADQFGRDYTLYVSTKDADPEETKKGKKKSRKQKEPELAKTGDNDDLPF